jgi:hypothetical protein
VRRPVGANLDPQLRSEPLPFVGDRVELFVAGFDANLDAPCRPALVVGVGRVLLLLDGDVELPVAGVAASLERLRRDGLRLDG